jgi:hypothetical protein
VANGRVFDSHQRERYAVSVSYFRHFGLMGQLLRADSSPVYFDAGDFLDVTHQSAYIPSNHGGSRRRLLDHRQRGGGG